MPAPGTAVGGGCRYKLFLAMSYAQIALGLSLTIYSYAAYPSNLDDLDPNGKVRAEEPQLHFGTLSMLAGILVNKL